MQPSSAHPTGRLLGRNRKKGCFPRVWAISAVGHCRYVAMEHWQRLMEIAGRWSSAGQSRGHFLWP
eukprot:11008249-Prorocentrum_lima.AAC.1